VSRSHFDSAYWTTRATFLHKLSRIRSWLYLGITGLWQVKGRQQDFDLVAAQDLRYLDSWSFGLDLKILAATLPAVVGGSEYTCFGVICLSEDNVERSALLSLAIFEEWRREDSF